ncbi:hypothetical protein A0257_22380 (plasmid) [Hymenobacter psoromatis]|nr:hypothetical protein A0257_22380 [Hymenobacter psoromatis]
MSADDIYKLMKDVQVQLEAFLKREEPITRAELAEYSKVIKAQAVPVLDPIRLAQQLMPELVAQLPKQLPMKVELKTEEIAKLLSPVINRQVAAIEATNERLLRGLTQHLATIDATLAARLQALETREASLRAATDRIPSKVSVDFVRGFRDLAMIALGPLALGMVILALGGAFSKEPVATYNALVEAYGTLKSIILK